jgi:hypothetical protein
MCGWYHSLVEIWAGRAIVPQAPGNVTIFVSKVKRVITVHERKDVRRGKKRQAREDATLTYNGRPSRLLIVSSVPRDTAFGDYSGSGGRTKARTGGYTIFG